MSEVGRRVEELVEVLESTRARLVATVRGISPALTEVRPRNGDWSVAEVMTHLALVDARIASLVTKLVDQARTDGATAGGKEDSVINSLDRFRLMEVVTKVPAPASMVPEPVRTIEESFTSLELSRSTLCKALLESADMNLDAYVQANPLLKDLNVYQWALFGAQHEERHRRQIERTIDEVTELAVECAPLV